MQRLLTGRVNVKLLIIIGTAFVLSIGALAGGHHVRKRSIANRALTAGRSAAQAQNWPEAATQLRLYLSSYPNDAAVLEEYARAQLSIRPLRSDQLVAAVIAYRRLLRFQPGDRRLCDRLVRLYGALRNHNEVGYVARLRLEADPTDAAAMAALGRSLLAQRRADDVQRELSRYVANGKVAPEVCALLADAAMQATPPSPDAALKWLNTAVESNPDSAAALAFRGRFYLTAKKNPEQARADLSSADKLGSADAPTRLLLAEVWLDLKEYDRAEAELDLFEQSPLPPETLDFEWQDLRLRQYRLAARSALLQEDKAACARLADFGLSDFPEPQRGRFLQDAVHLYLAGEQIDRARGLLTELHADSAGANIVTLAVLNAAVASAEGRFYEAIAFLEPAVAGGDPYDPEVWRQLGYAYVRTGQERRALRPLDRYLARNPEDGEVALDLARISVRRQDWADVQKYAAIARQYSAGDCEPSVLQLQAELHTAGLPLSAEKAAELTKKLAQLRQKHPRRLELDALQVQVALSRGGGEEALVEAQQALQTPDAVPAALQAFTLLQRQGRLDAAVALGERLLHSLPTSSPLALAVADLQVAAGRRADAGNTLSTAASALTGPAAADVRRALARVLISDNRSAEGLAILNQLRAERPDDLQTRVALLQVKAVQDDAASAQALVDEVRAIEGDTGLQWRMEQARVLMNEVDWRTRQQEILGLLDRCINADAAWSEPVELRGTVLEQVGKDEEAEATYRRYFDHHPGSVGVLTRLLDLLERRGQFEAAARILERSPAAPLLTGHRATIAIGRGDYPAAIRELEARALADPVDAAAKVLLAGLLFRHQHDPEEAMTMLDAAEAIDPLLPEILVTRVDILRGQGRLAEAERLLDREVERRNDFVAYQQRARLHADTGRYEEAEEDYQKLTTLGGASGKGFLELGGFYRRNGFMDKALAAYHQGLKAEPRNDELRRALLDAQLSSSDPDVQREGLVGIEAELRRSPKDASLRLMRVDYLLGRDTPQEAREAVVILEQMIQADAHNVTAHDRLVRQAMQQGDLIRAGQLAARASGANPENNQLTLLRAKIESDMNNNLVACELASDVLQRDSLSVSARNLLARLELKAGRLAPAEKLNEQVFKLQPDDEDAHLIRVAILEARGKHDDAVAELESYCRTPSGRRSIRALLTLAEMDCADGRFDRCRQHLTEAEKLAPHDFNTFLVRLKLAAAQEDFSQLPVLLEDRLRRRPAESQAVIATAAMLGGADQATLRRILPILERFVAENSRIAAGYLALAVTAYRVGNLPGAESAYRRILELEPYHREALNNLAWILAQQANKTRDALDLANKAVLRYPDDPNLLNTRGVIYYQVGNLAQAREDFQRCLTLDTVMPATRSRSLAWLGRIALREGQRSSAINLFREALEVDKSANALSAEERGEIAQILTPTATQAAVD